MAYSGFILHPIVFLVNPLCNVVLYSLRKKGLSCFRLAKDHKLRLTWFRKLRLVDPPNTDNVCVCSEHFPEECFIVDMQATMGPIRQKEAWRKMLYQIYCLSISRLSQECFPKDKQNVLRRIPLVACHTDAVLIINIEIHIIRPDMN